MKTLLAMALAVLLLSTTTDAGYVGSRAMVFQPDPKPLSPSDAVVMAAGDVRGLATEDLRYAARYLSLHNIPATERGEYCQLLDFIINSLSRGSRTISYCTPVPGSNGAVVRMILDDYRWTHDAWENLAIKGSGPVRISKKIDQPEEYFYSVHHTQETKKTVKKQRQQRNAKGELLFYDVGKPNERPAMEDYDEVIVTPAISSSNWVDPTAMLALQQATKSSYPILRADWFMANASIAPAYNEILGFKKLADFHDLVRFRKVDSEFGIKGIVTDSQEVALHQRAILSTPTIFGRYWETFDYKDSRGEDNLLKDLVKKRRDAGEIFAEGPNGLQYFLLINEKDEIVDFADPFVAQDQTSPWRHKLVFGGMASCVTCHVNGAKAVNEEVRALTAPPFGLLTRADERKKAEEVKDLFFSGGTDELIKNTQFVNANRVGLATRGLTPAKNSAIFRNRFVNYWQGTLTIDDAAREVGSTASEIKPLINALKAPAPDPVLIQLVQGRPARRDMWLDGAYQQLATIMYQLRRVKP